MRRIFMSFSSFSFNQITFEILCIIGLLNIYFYSCTYAKEEEKDYYN
jgi:hypothetical protein